uniref:Peptidase A2 domain-containing protein n=1 Tax=Heligmosomoides polygyrus TaxID=6339 RepID=A0A183FC85_HELPZ
LKLLDKIEADPNCTIHALTEECKRLLNLKHDTKMIEDGSPKVQAVNRPSPHLLGRNHQQPPSPLQQKAANKKTEVDSKRSPRLPPTPCWLCGAMHFVRNCNYREHQCSNCHRTGHKDGFCRSARRRTRQSRFYRSARPNTRSDAVFTISSIDCGQYRRFATITVDGQSINFQVDSASDVTIVNEMTWKLMGKPELQPSSLIAHSASGDRIHFIGQRQCTYSFNAASAQGTFYVSNNPSNLLGAEWISKLGIYSIMDSLPCTDPGNPTAIDVSIANLERDNVAEKLQAAYPDVFKS